MNGYEDQIDPEDLASLNDAFKAAPDASERVPDGPYQTFIESAELRRSKKSGAPMIEYKLRISQGPHEGRLLWKNAMLEERSFAFVKADLRSCGLELEELSDLPGRLSEILDLPVEVNVKTKGEYQNVSFRRQGGNGMVSQSNEIPI